MAAKHHMKLQTRSSIPLPSPLTIRLATGYHTSLLFTTSDDSAAICAGTSLMPRVEAYSVLDQRPAWYWATPSTERHYGQFGTYPFKCVEHSRKSSLLMCGMHSFHTPLTELIFLDCQKMWNALRNFILAMDSSMAISRISVDWV